MTVNSQQVAEAERWSEILSGALMAEHGLGDAEWVIPENLLRVFIAEIASVVELARGHEDWTKIMGTFMVLLLDIGYRLGSMATREADTE